MKQNTNSVRAASFNSMVQNSIGLLEHSFRDSEFAAFIVRAERDPDALSRDESERWDAYMTAVYRHFGNLVYQHRVGALDRVLTAAGLRRTRCDGDGDDFGLGDRIDRPGSGGDRRHALSSGAPRPPRPARAPLDWMLPPADVGTVTGLPRSGRNASRGIAFWPVEVLPPVS